MLKGIDNGEHMRTIRAINVRFLEDVKLEMVFEDGKVARYGISRYFIISTIKRA